MQLCPLQATDYLFVFLFFFHEHLLASLQCPSCKLPHNVFVLQLTESVDYMSIGVRARGVLVDAVCDFDPSLKEGEQIYTCVCVQNVDVLNEYSINKYTWIASSWLPWRSNKEPNTKNLPIKKKRYLPIKKKRYNDQTVTL